MKARRILLDAYWLADGPPSGRNVVTAIAASWNEAFPEDRLVLAVPARINLELAGRVDQAVVRPTLANHAAWIQLDFPRLSTQPWDVVVTQNFSPLRGFNHAHRAVFFHDAMYADHPEWFSFAERRYLGFAGLTLRRSHTVLTSSANEAGRISRVYPFTAKKVHPVGLSIPLGLQRVAQDDLVNDPVNDRAFILAVGRLNVRKNLTRLIDAFVSSTKLRPWDLLIVGSADGRADSRYATHPRVKFLGAVSDEQLAKLYTQCRGFVFPSLDEGFGLPLIEAKFFGAPISASDIAPFREVGGVATFFDPLNVEGIRGSLEVLADQPRESVETVSRLDRHSPPSWVEVVRGVSAAVSRASSD